MGRSDLVKGPADRGWYEPLDSPEDIARAVAYAPSFAPASINTMADRVERVFMEW